MNVQDFVTAASESRKYSFPPESLFTYSHPDGEKVLCLGSFNFSSEVEKLIEEDPALMSREVIRESVTQEEVDELDGRNSRLGEREFPMNTTKIDDQKFMRKIEFRYERHGNGSMTVHGRILFENSAHIPKDEDMSRKASLARVEVGRKIHHQIEQELL